MNQLKMLTPLAVLIAGAMLLLAAEPPNRSVEFRNKFINEFHRTGLNTTPGDAMMLRILAASHGAKRGVEVGAASGYGAINMGIAFERNGGHLYTLEIDPKRAAVTRANIKKMGLEKTVTCIEGDALETLRAIEGPIDFAFLDAAKEQYFGYLKILEPKLAPGAVVAADNVIKLGHKMQDFLDYIENSPNYETVIIRASMEKGDGMSISYKLR